MSRAKELNDYLAAVADDSDNVRPPLAPRIQLDPRLEARAVEMVAAGWLVYKLEVSGDEPVRPSEIIAQAEKARGCGHE